MTRDDRISSHRIEPFERTSSYPYYWYGGTHQCYNDQYSLWWTCSRRMIPLTSKNQNHPYFFSVTWIGFQKDTVYS